CEFALTNFANKVKDHFTYFRANKAYIIETKDKTAAYLDKSQYENNKVWKTLGVYVWPNHVWFDTYQEEVDHLKNWLSTKMDWLGVNL
ncbi:MAG TPA: hypothetical protein DDZ39_02715, partial [Flavobacteriaceae bacterium]|nr:hypothetical protein [Flavobacteriaceae bacterium]